MQRQNKERKEEPKIHVNEEWKRAVAEEKARLREEEQSQRRQKAEAGRGGPPPEPTIEAFIAGLYTQTLIALGELESPLTGEKATDTYEAELLIDTIAMLEKKTKGNLTPEESTYVRNVLTDLRMRYVRVAQQAEEEKGDQPPAE